MNKDKIEQKRKSMTEKNVEGDETLRLTADLEGNYLLNERTSRDEMVGDFLFSCG